jgi:TRAP-type mannitol/chloroaromatic compound transport system permease small subunit
MEVKMWGLRFFLRTIDMINEWTGKIAAWLIIPLVFIATFEVIARYVFNRPTIWAWDINEWLMAGLTILMGGYIFLKNGHVTVDVVVRHLSPRPRAIIDLVTFVVFFIGIGALLCGGTGQAWQAFMTREESGTVFKGPIYIVKMAWPLGVFFLLLQGVAKFIRDLMTVIQPKRGKN